MDMKLTKDEKRLLKEADEIIKNKIMEKETVDLEDIE